MVSCHIKEKIVANEWEYRTWDHYHSIDRKLLAILNIKWPRFSTINFYFKNLKNCKSCTYSGGPIRMPYFHGKALNKTFKGENHGKRSKDEK